jgi:hypothetical protein
MDVDPRIWARPGNVSGMLSTQKAWLTKAQAADQQLSTLLTSGANGPLAYGLSRTLGLPQLGLGAFAAALNADNYVAFAVGE